MFGYTTDASFPNRASYHAVRFLRAVPLREKEIVKKTAALHLSKRPRALSSCGGTQSVKPRKIRLRAMITGHY